jgi:hypothetical protein
MAAFMLETLVLRGVSVLCDGQANNLRRGTSGAAGRQTKANSPFERQPSSGWMRVYANPIQRLDHAEHLDVGQALGAGRSRRHDSVVRCHSAIREGRAIPLGTAGTRRGPKPAAARNLRWLPTRLSASASLSPSERSATASVSSRFTCTGKTNPVQRHGKETSAVLLARSKPASGTFAARTRGTEVG